MQCPPWDISTIKNYVLSHSKVNPPFRKWFLEKTLQDWKLSLICFIQHWKKIAEILQKRNFLIWNIQNFARRVKQFVRKYYISWLIDLPNKLFDAEKIIIKIIIIIKNYEIKWEIFNSVNLWISSYKKGKNE